MGLGKIIKMDLWGNQFSCCVLNGGIEMKCRIIKKITSPPSHVIMSGSRGSGLCHSAGGSAFDLTERTPGLVQHTAAQWGGFTAATHWGYIANHTDCLRTVCLSTRQIISRYCCQRKRSDSGGWGGGVLLLGCLSQDDSELAWKVTGAVVWNMFHSDHNAQSVVGC